MQNGDEALLSIILASQGLLVKMLIILQPHHIFWSNFVYLYILNFSRHWYGDNLNNLIFYKSQETINFYMGRSLSKYNYQGT